MPYQLAPQHKFRAFDTNGDPLAGGKLYTYAATTETPQGTYQTQAGTANTNPVILDAYGKANVWLDPALSYKFVLKDSNDVTQETIDNIIGLLTPDAVNTASIADLAVTTAKIAALAVTAAKLASSVGTDGDRAVTSDHIRNDAVTTIKVLDANVTRAKLATGAIGAGSVTAVKTTTYPITTSDDLIQVSGASGAYSVTLPTAVGCSGRAYTIKRTDSTFANVVTLATTSSQTIDGATTRAIHTLGESVTVVSDGANWVVREHKCDTVWTAYSPTIDGNGWGTCTGESFLWRRVGDSLEVNGTFTSGTAGAALGIIPLPTGFALDAAKLATANATSAPGPLVGAFAVSGDTDCAGPVVPATTTSTAQVYAASLYNQAAMLTPANISSLYGNNLFIAIEFSVPISGWWT